DRGAAGGAGRGIAAALAETGLEPVIAEEAQHILLQAARGVADKADMARLEIGPAADRVEQRAVGRQVDRVDREIPARGIGGPAGVESDDGVAAVGLDVAAE